MYLKTRYLFPEILRLCYEEDLLLIFLFIFLSCLTKSVLLFLPCRTILINTLKVGFSGCSFYVKYERNIHPLILRDYGQNGFNIRKTIY